MHGFRHEIDRVSIGRTNQHQNCDQCRSSSGRYPPAHHVNERCRSHKKDRIQNAGAFKKSSPAIIREPVKREVAIHRHFCGNETAVPGYSAERPFVPKDARIQTGVPKLEDDENQQHGSHNPVRRPAKKLKLIRHSHGLARVLKKALNCCSAVRLTSLKTACPGDPVSGFIDAKFKRRPRVS